MPSRSSARRNCHSCQEARGSSAGGEAVPDRIIHHVNLVCLHGLCSEGEKQTLEYGKFVVFPVWTAIKLDEVDILCELEEKLEGIANVEELSRACRIACWSIQDQESSRPTRGLVVQQLEGLSNVSMPPIPGLLQRLTMDGSMINWNTSGFCTSLVSE